MQLVPPHIISFINPDFKRCYLVHTFFYVCVHYIYYAYRTLYLLKTLFSKKPKNPV